MALRAEHPQQQAVRVSTRFTAMQVGGCADGVGWMLGTTGDCRAASSLVVCTTVAHLGEIQAIWRTRFEDLKEWFPGWRAGWGVGHRLGGVMSTRPICCSHNTRQRTAPGVSPATEPFGGCVIPAAGKWYPELESLDIPRVRNQISVSQAQGPPPEPTTHPQAMDHRLLHLLLEWTPDTSRRRGPSLRPVARARAGTQTRWARRVCRQPTDCSVRRRAHGPVLGKRTQ